MKHKRKICLVYICLALTAALLILYRRPRSADIHRLVSETRSYLKSPKFWGQYLTVEEAGQATRNGTNNTIHVGGFSCKKVNDDSAHFNSGGARNNCTAKARKNNSSSSFPFVYSELTANDAYWNTDVPPAAFVKAMPKEFQHSDEDVWRVKEDLSSLKKILVWNEGYGSKTMGFGFGRSPFQLAKCEVDSCFMTGNRSIFHPKEIDAIIFHFRTMQPRDLPHRLRYAHQRWIFEEVESASYVYQDPAIYNAIFNWTMTYRRDSDIVYPYGRVYKVNSTSDTPLKTKKNYAEGKTKLAAWFVSNCHSKSKREKIVRLLRKHFETDIFGNCGPYDCPHSDECYSMLEKTYKFYFSFENSLCRDYVTEKLFNILRYDIIPVVYGLADYKRIAPPGSFINILDFPDVTSLAKYLKYLDGNDTAYNEYFKWKDHYTIDNHWSNTAQTFCNLCKRLHEDKEPKVYNDIKQWFMIQGGCKQLKTKGWF